MRAERSRRKAHVRLVETCLLSLCWHSEWGLKIFLIWFLVCPTHASTFSRKVPLPVIHFPLCANVLCNSGGASGARCLPGHVSFDLLQFR